MCRILKAFVVICFFSGLIIPAVAGEKNAYVKETPKADQQAKTILQGSVSESQMEEELKNSGIVLQKQDSKFLPAVVAEVTAFSLAEENHIRRGDLILKAEHERNALCITIERDGKKYRAVLFAGKETPVSAKFDDTWINGSAAGANVAGRDLFTENANRVEMRRPAELQNPSRVNCGCGGAEKKYFVSDPDKEMQNGTVRIQMKINPIGGNPCEVNMTGSINLYTKDAIEIYQSSAFCDGGRVPAGKVWVIKQIKYSGYAHGDSNGPGLFAIMALLQDIVIRAQSNQPIEGIWNGEIIVRPGQESKVCVVLSNSSACDVSFFGELR